MKPHRRLPVTLAVLVQDLEYGGTQRYALELVKRLDRKRFTPTLWVLRGGEDMANQARRIGAEISWLSQQPQVGPAAIFKLLHKLSLDRPTILYTLTVVPNIWGRLLGGLLRTPAIVSGYRSLLPKQHERWLWRLSRRIICNAGALKDIMIERCGVPPERIAVIPNSVDHDYFIPDVQDKADVPTVLYLGRFVSDKDPTNLLESFRLTAARHPTVKFEMVGDGPLFGPAKDFILRHGLTDRISLSHGVEDVRPHLRKAWVLALGSRREASPNVILEAMATGLPVAATSVGGIPEIVTHGNTGLLVPPDDPERMAESITALLEDGEMRGRFGKNARQAVLDLHSPALIVRRTEEVLLEALNTRQA